MRTTPPDLLRDYRERGWWSDTLLTDLFDAAATAHPDRSAVVDPPNRTDLIGGPPLRLSYAALADLADGYALRMLELGLRRDDILITQLPNIAEYVAVYIAAMRLGVILSPVPMQFRRRELDAIVALTHACAALTVRSFKGVEHAAGAVSSSQGQSFKVLCLGNDCPPDAIAFTPASVTAQTRASLREHVRANPINSADIVTICWTSGTEGMPKGVPRSHNHWMAISYAHLRGAGIKAGERLLNPFPLINMAAIGGCFLSWLHAAGTLVLHHPLDLGVFLRQIATEKPQYAIAPPAILNMLLKDETLLANVDMSSLRCIGSGSAPLDPEMIRGFHDRFGIEIANMFGSNEGVSLVSNAENATDPEHRARFFPRYGRAEVKWTTAPHATIETRIVEPDSGKEILVGGQAGELQIRGPTVFDGYFRADHLTAKAFTPDGYFRTGDLFQLEGPPEDLRYYRFVGRLGHVINRGGVKIAPEELDAVLSQMPDVLEGAVASYRDSVMGERICAVVVPRPGTQPPTLDSVREHFAKAGLAIFKRPERILVLEQLPRNSVGKVLRGDLSKQLEPADSA